MPKLNGKFNRSKAKVLLILWLNKQRRDGADAIRSALDLYVCTGVSYASLKSLLLKWYRWRYVSRHAIKQGSTWVWGYAITAKGTRFIEKVMEQPEFERLNLELKQWQQYSFAKYSELPVEAMSAGAVVRQMENAKPQLRKFK